MWSAVVGIGALYVGSTIATPLYPVYQRAFGLSELVVTEIYAVYVVGNLGVLFWFGRLSDQIGRRRTTLAALVLSVVSALCFLCAPSSAWLFQARVLNGLAVGLGAGALTAWIAELEPQRDKSRATLLASAGNLAGLGFGALGAGLLARYAPSPLRSSYLLYLALLGVVMSLIRAAPETVSNPAHAIAELSLRPRIGVPRGKRLAFVAPAALAFAAFALGGFYAALAPGLLQRIGLAGPALAGAVVAAFFGAGALAAASVRKVEGRAALLWPVPLLLAGLALLMLAEAERSLSLIVVASLVAGPAMALGYRGSLQVVNEIAPNDRRAELVSSYLLVCYTANSLPVIGTGLLSRAFGATIAHAAFAILLALLGLVAAAMTLVRTSGGDAAGNAAH